MKKVAKIIFLNPEKEALLQLRDNNPKIASPNCWDLIGGAIEGNETPLEAIKREVEEEICFALKDAKFVKNFFITDNSKDYEIFIFFSEIKEPLENLCLTEGQKLSFFKPDEIKNLELAPVLKRVISDGTLSPHSF